jgi:hypothetical protein
MNAKIETLRSLKQQDCSFTVYEKLTKLAVEIVGVKATEPMAEYVTDEDLAAVGFSSDEANAILFVMTQDCMGQPCTSAENVSRFLTYSV